jgi:hypothetical protein
MPCYATYNISVELTGMHPEILKRAIESLGYKVMQTASGLCFYCQGMEVRIENGTISLDQSQTRLINEIKQAYSREVIQIACRQYGLELQPLSENQVLVKKRF